ncbi:glycosyltransferase [Flavimaricola marinus]|uniref:Galactofuranosyl transferase GlfT1 n=1 Tax=Flavimaricola marinus TaxID=1819565 RepID=A0A238LIM1_9RHOB|nr:glycosyltransferase [Flavimaricola marinus]SMY09245.1 Galactofuranosyl transferase GlfT1 [Flavimaricola marinus]
MKLAALVVTFNRPEALAVTLDRLFAEEVDHVVVVDNASSPETPALLAGLTDPRLHVIRLEDNTGGAGGFETGLRHIRDVIDPDWTVLMDDDARPAQGAFGLFRREYAAIDPSSVAANALGVVAAAVFFPDGDLCEMNRPSRNPFWHFNLFMRTVFLGGRSGFHLSDADFAPDAPATDIDVASFVGYFISRGGVRRTGLPEGGMFIYGDDVTYSLRLRRTGGRIMLDPAIRFEHDCRTLGEGLATRPLWKVYYLCRNGVSIAGMAAGRLLFPFALTWYLIAWTRKTRHYSAAERPLYRKMLWRGVRDGLLGRRGRNDAIHALAQTAPLS